MQADRVGPRHCHHRVGPLQRHARHRVAAEAYLVVEQLLLFLQAEADVGDGQGERRAEQLDEGLPGGGPHLRPQLRPGQPWQHPGAVRRRLARGLPQPGHVQLAPAGQPRRPGQAGHVVQEAEHLGHRATVGVGVHQQRLPHQRGRLERQVHGHRGPPGRPPRPPHHDERSARRGRGGRGSGWRRTSPSRRAGRGPGGGAGGLVGAGLGVPSAPLGVPHQRRHGQVHQRPWGVGVLREVHDAELPQPPLRLLVPGGHHPHDHQP